MLNKKLRILLSLPKTIFFNLRYLPFSQAWKLPIFVSYDTDISVKGSIHITSLIKTAMVRIGFLCPLPCDTHEQTRLFVQNGGSLFINGSAHIGHGARIVVRPKARLSFGDNFAISGCTTINCYKEIIFGQDIQFSWNCLVMDSDTHSIFDVTGRKTNEDKAIIFGNKIWIGCNVTVLKGSTIPSNCIIGASSLVAGGKFEEGSIIIGNPAKSTKTIGCWNI